MQGKTVVITGGTSGIGEVAAKALAGLGARIVLVARDKSRANATLARLPRGADRLDHAAYFADLTRLAEMKRVAAQIADKEPPIDALGVSLQAPHSTFIPARAALRCHSSNADWSFKAAGEGIIGRHL